MKANKYVFIFLTLYQVAAYAMLSEDDLRKFKQEGQNIAKGLESNISGSFQDKQLQETIGFEGTNIRGNNMQLEEVENLSVGVMQHNDEQALREMQGESVTYQCNKETCEVGHTFSSLSTVKRHEELDKQGFERDENGNPINNQAYLDKVLSFAKNNEFNFLSGSTSNCQPIEENITTSTQETCDQYYDLKTSSCFPKQIVEIDPEYKYSCNKIREEKLKICREEIVSITCKDSHECDLGGIERGSVDSDMKFEFSNGVLTIGTIADNYWGGSCATYDRTTTFKITNKDKIKDFFLFKVGFDDYMQITLNGHLIYVGPDGGNKLEVVTRQSGFWHHNYQVVNNGSGDSGCERGTNWTREPNVDLRPYLKEGENILKTRVIVAGWGEGRLQIRAKQNCCSKWEIKREEKCDIS